MLFKLAQQLPLMGEDLGHGDRQREVSDAIDLWKPLPASRPRRPLDPERVARKRRQDEIGFECPDMDHFAVPLLDRRQGNEVTQDDEIRLLGEFAPRRVEKLGTRLGEAFRDRPRPILLLGPERAARMREKDLQLAHPPEC
jgi:hypothetical protein